MLLTMTITMWVLSMASISPLNSSLMLLVRFRISHEDRYADIIAGGSSDPYWCGNPGGSVALTGAASCSWDFSSLTDPHWIHVATENNGIGQPSCTTNAGICFSLVCCALILTDN